MCLDTTIKKQLPNKYPQFIMGVLALAQAKNGDEQFWKQKQFWKHGKAQHALKVP
jgi:hypothetical protein